MYEKVSMFEVSKIIFVIITYVLDLLLFLVLLPFMICERISTRHRAIVILRAIFEVKIFNSYYKCKKIKDLTVLYDFLTRFCETKICRRNRVQLFHGSFTVVTDLTF